MFNQVRIFESDVDALFFVWRETKCRRSTSLLVQHFGKADSPCISNWSINIFLKKNTPDAEYAINSIFYANNFLKFKSNKNDLVKHVIEVMSVLNLDLGTI